MVIVRLRDGSKIYTTKARFNAIRYKKGIVKLHSRVFQVKDIVGHDYTREGE